MLVVAEGDAVSVSPSSLQCPPPERRCPSHYYFCTVQFEIGYESSEGRHFESGEMEDWRSRVVVVGGEWLGGVVRYGEVW